MKAMKLVIGLYGPNLDETCRSHVFSECWHWAVAEMTNHDLSVTDVAVALRKPVVGLKDMKPYVYARKRRAVSDQIKKGNVNWIQLTSASDKPNSYLAFDWKWTAEFYDDAELLGTVSLGIDCSILKMTPAETARRYIEYGCMSSPKLFGFAVMMPSAFLPSGYVVGLACDEAADELIVDANAWMDFALKRAGSCLRNVFGLNILNSTHLELDVGGRPLKEWVQAESYRGRIEPLAKGLFLWTFQEQKDEEAFLHWDYPPVVRVREELKQLRLFPWQDLMDDDSQGNG